MKMAQVHINIVKPYRLQMATLTLFADLIGFGLAGMFAYLLNFSLHFFIFGLGDTKYSIAVIICLALFMTSRLYPGVGINPADEIKLVTQFVTSGFMIGLIIFMVTEPGWKPNYWALLPTWGASLLFLLLSRWSMRILSVQFGLWGEPVIVIGKESQMQHLAQYFVQRRRLGFVPVSAFTSTIMSQGTAPHPVPMIDLKQLDNFSDEYFSKDGIQTAFVDLSAVPNAFHEDASRSLFRLFRHVIFISDANWLEGASLGICDFEGLIGMEARKSPISSAEKTVKRMLDIVVSLIGGILLLPFFLILSMLIKLDSPGPVIYSQERIGKGKNKIRIYKFRSMQQDADQTLEKYLLQHQEERLEWDRNQKLKNDPRLTRIGKFLRKFSIDEFPQLWNVLKGDMSLVGPRPMTIDQESLYGAHMNIYCRVRPGMSGLWQVSGRNQTTFHERARFDYYYVHNWSIWLDIYILLRTAWVVLGRDGAY